MNEGKEKSPSGDLGVKVPVKFIDWGLTDYQDAWDRQETIFNETVALKTKNRTENTQLETPNFLIWNVKKFMLI